MQLSTSGRALILFSNYLNVLLLTLQLNVFINLKLSLKNKISYELIS